MNIGVENLLDWLHNSLERRKDIKKAFCHSRTTVKQKESIIEIWSRQADSFVEELCKAAKNKSIRIRIKAIKAMGEGTLFDGALHDALEDESEKVRQAAQEVIHFNKKIRGIETQ